MNEHRVPSIRETLSWYKDKLKNGKASEEMFKTEALSFFNLSPEMGAKDKRSFKREIEHFADMHQSLLRKWLREFLAENGGLGKNHDNPPSDFGLEIENENDRKRAIKQLRSNQRNKLTCTFLALTLREVIPLKKMGQNFHICLRSGPTGLTPPPLTVRLTIKYPFFMTSLS